MNPRMGATGIETGGFLLKNIIRDCVKFVKIKVQVQTRVHVSNFLFSTLDAGTKNLG